MRFTTSEPARTEVSAEYPGTSWTMLDDELPASATAKVKLMNAMNTHFEPPRHDADFARARRVPAVALMSVIRTIYRCSVLVRARVL